MDLLWLIILESFVFFGELATLVEDFLKETFLGEISKVIVQPTKSPKINGNSIIFFMVVIRLAQTDLA